MVGVIGTPKYQRDIAPTMPISIIRQTINGQREIATATWWLALDRATLKPSKYSSFNSRSDKLHEKRSIAYQPYRKARCIIPASALIERYEEEPIWHMIEPENYAVAFGGLYQDYFNPETGEIVTGASLITLPPVPAWEKIHPKSLPLMLDYTDKQLIDRWLDPTVTDVSEFEHLLIPKIRHTQNVTRIGKVSQWNPIAETFKIEADAA
jgi:putative SOS response-associated peptidase YedK